MLRKERNLPKERKKKEKEKEVKRKKEKKKDQTKQRLSIKAEYQIDVFHNQIDCQ